MQQTFISHVIHKSSNHIIIKTCITSFEGDKISFLPPKIWLIYFMNIWTRADIHIFPWSVFK